MDKVNINLNLHIDLTPQMEQFIGALLALVKAQTQNHSAVVASAINDEAQSLLDKTAEDSAKETAKEPTPAVAAPTTTTPPKQPEVADIRECMHRIRQRFEGEDYENNTKSEGYIKYHKALNVAFKTIAATIGNAKPSELAPEYRQAFIDECAKLTLNDKGEFTIPCPF